MEFRIVGVLVAFFAFGVFMAGCGQKGKDQAEIETLIAKHDYAVANLEQRVRNLEILVFACRCKDCQCKECKCNNGPCKCEKCPQKQSALPKEPLRTLRTYRGEVLIGWIDADGREQEQTMPVAAWEALCKATETEE